MKKVMILLPALMLLAACGSSPDLVAPAAVGLNATRSVVMTPAPAAEALDYTDEIEQNIWGQGDMQVDRGSLWGDAEPQPAAEGDAWANTCGPNAGYEEQLVCSGVSGGSVPRG